MSTVNTAKNYTLYAQWTPKTHITDSYFTNLNTVTVPYDKTAHPFALEKAENADSAVALDSFIVQYKGSNPVYSANRWVWFVEKDENGETVKQNVGPIDSERYDVMIYRPESETHQMYKRTVPAGVTINKIDRPADVSIAPPTKATNVTFNSVTVNPATVTCITPGADGGTVVYRMDTYQISKMGDDIVGTEQREATSWASTQTLQSKVANMHTPGMFAFYIERRIYAGISGDRNYNDLLNTTEYLVVDGKSPLKDASKELTSNIHLKVTTAGGADDGTSNSIYAGLLNYNAPTGGWTWNDSYLIRTNNSKLSDGYGKNDVQEHDRTVTTDPWMLGGPFVIWKDGSNGWKYADIEFTFTSPFINKTWTVNTQSDWMDSNPNDRKYKFAEPDAFQRVITGTGAFAKLGWRAHCERYLQWQNCLYLRRHDYRPVWHL